MSSDVDSRSSLVNDILSGRLSYRVVALLGVVVVLVVATPILLLFLRDTTVANTGPIKEDYLLDQLRAEVREALSQQTDITTVKTALGRVNAYLNQHPTQRAATLKDAERARLERALNLSTDELGEIDSTAYTGLDAHHLDLCFLLRDVAQALQADVRAAGANDATVKLTPLEQVTAAFNWVVREVLLEDTSLIPTPPQFVLRRGRGTALQRSMIFLELLRQFNLDSDTPSSYPGCLFIEPGSGQDKPDRVLAVGVVIDKDLYLFDPGLGLPIPGPDGKGVATLAQALKEPGILGQLTVNEKVAYDVRSERLQKSEPRLCVSLSALAPRLAYLDKEVLAPGVHVNLAADFFADEAAVLTALQESGAKVDKLTADPQSLRLLRSFLPPEEGGVDKGFGMSPAYLPGFAEPGNNSAVQMWRKRYVETELVPWLGLPSQLVVAFPFNSTLGSVIRERYAQPFQKSALEPKGARDQILRGQYREAINDLMIEREKLTNDFRQLQQDVEAAMGVKAFSDRVIEFLVKEALPAAATLEREKQNGPEALAQAAIQLQQVWDGNRDVNVLFRGAVAAQRRPQVTYLLAQAKHELAEQHQLRLDVLTRRSGPGPAKEDETRAKDGWRKAEEWWRHYADEYPVGPGASALRRQRGRCQMLLGDWQAAVSTWEDVSDQMPALEKVGNVYLAHWLRKQHESGGKQE
jgi:hypothetical protein